MRACGVGLSCKNNRRLFPAENENCSISLTIASPRSRDTANRRTHDRLVHKNFVDSVTMGGDTPMVEDLAPETAPLVPFGGQASGDWAAEVDAEHELSGRNADVLQAEREKAKARAERFGETYTEPSAKTLAGAHGLLSRKEVLAVRREQAEKKAKRGDRFITGIDLFDPAEEAKRLARAHKFGAMLTDVTAEQQLVREKAETEKKERDAKNKKETANLSGDVADGDGEGMDAEDALKTRRSRLRLGVAKRRRAPLRRGPHDHRGLRGVLRRVRPRVLRVDQRLVLQRRVQRRTRGEKGDSHERRRDGRLRRAGRQGRAS